MKTHLTRSPQETIDLGKRFAGQLIPGAVVALTGSLGSGKTQFVIGICEGLQARGHIASPTFTIINEYEAPFGTIVHVDLYRISKRSEIDELGMEEYFNDQCICLVEWPEIAQDLLPPGRIDVLLEHGKGDSERRITFLGAVFV